MADNDVKIKVTADGATQAAKELDKVTAALEKQRKTEEMIAKTSSDLARRSKIAGIQAEAAALNQLDAAMSKAAQAGAQLEATTGKAGLQFGQFRAASAASAALVGNLGRSFSTLVPAMAGMQGALQTGGMAMSQFLGVLGGGPGILLGGAVAAVGMLVTHMASAKTEADELAKATEANAKAMGSYLDQIQRLRSEVGAVQEQERTEKNLRSRLLSNQGSTDEYQREIATQQGRLDNPYYRDMYISQANNPGGLAKREAEAAAIRQYMDQLRGSQRYAQSEAQAAAQEAASRRAAGLDFEAAGTPSTPGGKKTPAGTLPGNDTNDYLMGQYSTDGQTADAMVRQLEAEKDAKEKADKAWTDQWMESQQQKADVAQMFRDEEDEKVRESLAKQVAEHEKARQAQAAADRMLGQTGVQAAQMVTGATLKGISEMVKGKEVEAGAILEGLGDQFVAAGTGLVFQGLGISANPFTPGAGAGMVGIGLAEIAFGLGLGAAGANSPGGSNSSSPSDAKKGGGNSDPYRNSFTPDAERGPTIINITIPTVTSPTAEDGLMIREAIRKSHQVYGT